MTTADVLAALAADQLAAARAAVRAQVVHCRGPEPEIVRIVLKAVLARKWDRYRSLQRATRLA